MAMKTILCVLFLTLCSSLVTASGAETNQVVSRTFNRPLSDVRSLMETNFGTLRTATTNGIGGLGYTVYIMSCSPPVSSGIWRQKVIPFWVKLGGKPPVRASFWMGSIVATRISDKKTRVEVCKKYSNPNSDTEASLAFMEKIGAALAAKK